MPKKILLTGGAGFIGSRTVLRLLALGHEVRVLDSLEPQIHGADPEKSYSYQLIRGHCEVIRASVLDAGALERAVRGQEILYHLAAETGTGQSMYALRHYAEVNITGTALLAEAVLTHGSVERVVLSSSRAIYGEGACRCEDHGIVYPPDRSNDDLVHGQFEPRCPICRQPTKPTATPEEAATRPQSVYAATKLAQEHLLRTALLKSSASLVMLRYQNVYGVGQSLRNPYTGIISIFSGAILRDQMVNIFEDGRESRDFIYVDDVAEANARAATQSTGNCIEINVGSGTATSVLEVYLGLARLLGHEPRYGISGEFRLGDIRHCYADTRRMQSVLGLVPAVSFNDGLKRVADWAAKQHGLGGELGNYVAAIEELRSRNLLKR
jgi:dTDP-L-rhamnose 4-epimerase